MAFSLSQFSMVQLVDGENLYVLFGDKSFDPKFNTIVTMQHLEDHKETFCTPQGVSYSSLVKAFLETICNQEQMEQAQKNLGSIQANPDGSYSFWSTGIYYEEDSLFFQVGGTDRENEIEPLRIPLVFDENRSTYVFADRPSYVSQSWKIETIERQGDDYSTIMTLGLVNPKSKVEKNFSIWTRIKKSDDDPTSAKVCDQAYSALYDNSLPLDECILGTPKGNGGITAKSSFLSPYYKAKTLKTFAFKVIGIELIVRQKKDSEETFRQLLAHVDFSEHPDLPVIAVDMSGKNKDGMVVSLPSVTKIQFNTGRTANPSALYGKYLACLRHKEEDEEGISEPKKEFLFPSEENPWVVEYKSPPSNPTNTPKYSVWSSVKPPKVLALIEATKSPAFFGKASEELLEALTEAIEVPVSFASPDSSDSSLDDDDDF